MSNLIITKGITKKTKRDENDDDKGDNYYKSK